MASDIFSSEGMFSKRRVGGSKVLRAVLLTASALYCRGQGDINYQTEQI